MRHFSLRRPLMTYRTGRWPWALTCLVAAVTLGAVALTSAQEKPRSGGELIFVVPAEPPSFDAHREETFGMRSEEHTSELQSRLHLVCRLLLEKKKKKEERYL